MGKSKSKGKSKGKSPMGVGSTSHGRKLPSDGRVAGHRAPCVWCGKTIIPGVQKIVWSRRKEGGWKHARCKQPFA